MKPPQRVGPNRGPGYQIPFGGKSNYRVKNDENLHIFDDFCLAERVCRLGN